MTLLREMMTLNLSIANPSSTVYEVATRLKEEQVGTIPICDDQDRLLGIVTDRDLVVSSIAERKPNTTPIGQIMTENPVTATPEMTVSQASQLMKKHQIRRLPVVDHEKLVGMISLSDLARREETQENSQQVLYKVSKPVTKRSQLLSKSGKITTLVTSLAVAGASILTYRKRKSVSQ